MRGLAPGWQVLRAESPDVAILAAAGRGNHDGEPVQSSLAEFFAQQASWLAPRRLVLSHHDDWLPGFAGAVDVAPIRAALARRAPDTELCELGYASGFTPFA